MTSLVSAERLNRAQAATAASELDALLITPGPDLRYLTGYDALPLERLTCLVVPGHGEPTLIAPRLEVPAAEASLDAQSHVAIRGWEETDDPFALASSLISGSGVVGVADTMPAAKVFGFREAMPNVRQVLAGGVMRELRIIKAPEEIRALRLAAEAIDRVHARVPDLLRPGRSERDVGQDIAELILEEGHSTVDFVIVGSGPNGASPHHELSDRVIEVGDPVVVDIGGTMPSGYCSDSTRTYCVGRPPKEFLDAYQPLQVAQQAAVDAVRPGVTAESVDAAARRLLTDVGYGEHFIHRTGHGIGVETHEHPYIVTGNTEVLQSGMAFSVEPGVYFPDQYGARIEDIVVVTDTGVESLNQSTRELVVVDHSFSS